MPGEQMALILSCSFDEKAPEQYDREAECVCLCVLASHIAYRNQQVWEMNKIKLHLDNS